MQWRCAECGEPESDKKPILVVCHHCGKLLCRDDRVAHRGDVFEREDETGDLAYHCADCYEAQHREPEPEQGQPA